MKWMVMLAALLALTGCGPMMVVLKDPATGAIAQCQPPTGKYWNPSAAAEACARGYEAAGYRRMSEY